MSFTSGTVKTLNEFFDVMTTYAVANEAWVILEGAENNSDSGVFPFNSRYLRVQFSDPADVDDLRIYEFDARATVAGADLNLTEAGVYNRTGDDNAPFNTITNLFDDNVSSYWDPDFQTAFFDYDFGAAQTIREFTCTAGPSADDAPRQIEIFRSEDGIFWDRIHVFNNLSWAANETKVLTLPADTTIFESSTATGGVRRPCRYVLQGPGYDIDRRVYVSCELFQDFTDGNQGFAMNGFTQYAADTDPLDQINALPYDETPVFVINNDTEVIDYWLYVNSSRIVACLSVGADYAQFHMGFAACFANPDQHTNPLYLAGTCEQTGTATSIGFRKWNEADTRNTCFWDPSEVGGGKFLDYEGTWVNVENNDGALSLGRKPLSISDIDSYFITPWHLGSSEDDTVTGNTSYAWTGDFNAINGDHFLKNQIETLQGEVPVWDALIVSRKIGNIAALQGIIAVPAATVLTPEQTIVLNAVTYRIFPKRTIRDDAQWIGIAEQ